MKSGEPEEENIVDKAMEGLGVGAGLYVGVATGLIAGGVKLLKGEGLRAAGGRLDEHIERAMDEGGKVGKKYGSLVLSTALTVLAGRYLGGGGRRS